MMCIMVSSDKTKYDARHDVLHVFLASCGNGIAYAEEEAPGIFVKRCEDTEEVVGLTILDFKKVKSQLGRLLPGYNFSGLI